MPRWGVKELSAIPGVGKAKACQLVAAFELACRFSHRAQPRIRKPKDVPPYIQHIADKKQEYFLCLNLNGRGR